MKASLSSPGFDSTSFDCIKTVHRKLADMTSRYQEHTQRKRQNQSLRTNTTSRQ
ncbi:unnamed protein product [Ixodes persulcatus]